MTNSDDDDIEGGLMAMSTGHGWGHHHHGSRVGAGANYFRVVPSLILASTLVTCLAIIIMMMVVIYMVIMMIIIIIIVNDQDHNCGECKRLPRCGKSNDHRHATLQPNSTSQKLKEGRTNLNKISKESQIHSSAAQHHYNCLLFI